MSNLPGNPHDNVNVDFADTNDGRISGEAILALAYEQRTANLIALHRMGVSAMLSGNATGISTEKLHRNSREIETRLGLGDTK